MSRLITTARNMSTRSSLVITLGVAALYFFSLQAGTIFFLFGWILTDLFWIFFGITLAKFFFKSSPKWLRFTVVAAVYASSALPVVILKSRFIERDPLVAATPQDQKEILDWIRQKGVRHIEPRVITAGPFAKPNLGSDEGCMCSYWKVASKISQNTAEDAMTPTDVSILFKRGPGEYIELSFARLSENGKEILLSPESKVTVFKNVSDRYLQAETARYRGAVSERFWTRASLLFLYSSWPAVYLDTRIKMPSCLTAKCRL